jgi:hypothetical protein
VQNPFIIFVFIDVRINAADSHKRKGGGKNDGA